MMSKEAVLESTAAAKAQERMMLQIRPHARLLTMLGEQLLKNERVALVELIKNAYDADASTVKVEFEGFTEDMKKLQGSRIVVRDNGCGMDLNTVRNAWMNPATPTKFLAKKKGNLRTPIYRRVIQGEKGIGRFAVLKLAKKFTVTTRTDGSPLETVVFFDFERFDDDFIEEDGKEKETFLDELNIACDERMPKTLPGEAHGTVIEMETLRGEWSKVLIEKLCADVANLTDPVSKLTRKKSADKFDIDVVCNGKPVSVSDENIETLKSLIEEKAVLSLKGRFQDEENLFRFATNSGKEEEINLEDPRMKGLRIFRQRFGKGTKGEAIKKQAYSCGGFRFQFHIFDFAKGISRRFLLSQDDRSLLKDHRVYLYRDGVRVYPYGDPEDDWLNIDVSRGTVRTGDFFSNDQLVGWVDITHAGNPNLRDKTNREGLIDTGKAVEDFKFLIRLFLSYIRQYPFSRHQLKQQDRNLAKSVRERRVMTDFGKLKEWLRKAGNDSHAKKLVTLEVKYRKERDYLTRRAETVEDLAGVGLSVEMASHDIMLLVGRARDIGIRLARSAEVESSVAVRDQADMLVGVLQQIVDGMRDVQSLFRSTRRRRKALRVEDILDKIHKMYSGLLDQSGITYNKEVVGTSPLTANTNDGVIMQVLINLFDNAAYWLETNTSSRPREIRVTLDGDAGELLFSDSGPGVRDEDKPYIFEAFFSGKGQTGRGLGLYIARQLLERHGYDIEMVDTRQGSLSGANFLVSFMEEETQ